MADLINMKPIFNAKPQRFEDAEKKTFAPLPLCAFALNPLSPQPQPSTNHKS
jgi:hypothetical protein